MAASVTEHQLQEGLTLQLTPEAGEKQGLGLWTLGLAAAHWASSLEGRRELAGRRVLELGSGVGLAGLACGAAAAEVTLTDYDDEVLDKLRSHVELNSSRLPAVKFRVARLDWDWVPSPAGTATEPEPEPEPEPELAAGVLGTPPRRFDVVLGADVCYSGMASVPDLFGGFESEDGDDDDCGAAASPRAWDNSANVAQTLAWCMARPNGVAHLFVHEGRSPDEVERFVERAAELGMVLEAREPLQLHSTAAAVAEAAEEAESGESSKSNRCMHDYTMEEGLVRLVVCWRDSS
jgi:hypothetical protein